MKKSIAVIALLFLLFSCIQNNNKKNAENLLDTLNKTTNITLSDSLDIDTSENYITSYFPKDVHDTIYTANAGLWSYITKSYNYYSKSDSLINFEVIKNNLLKDNFQIDTSDSKEVVYNRRFFNRRESITISDTAKEVFKYLIQNLYWKKQKKYIV